MSFFCEGSAAKLTAECTSECTYPPPPLGRRLKPVIQRKAKFAMGLLSACCKARLLGQLLGLVEIPSPYPQVETEQFI